MKQLSKIDKKILAELDTNSRQSFSQIAKRIKTSKEVVRYHFENLQKNRILKNCYALIDTYKLGYLIHAVWIKFRNLNLSIEQKIVEKLKSTKNVGVVIKLYGKWDLVICVWAKNIIEFNDNYKIITQDFHQFIKEQLVTVELNCTYKSLDFLYKSIIPPVKIGDKLEIIEIDKIDTEIIRQLARNSRTNSTELAPKLKLTPNAVLERIKRLEKKGVIAAYKINIDYEILGFMHHRIFLKTNNSQIAIKRIMEYLKRIPCVISIMNYSSYADIEFRICVRDTREIHELLTDLRNRFENDIQEYDSIMFLESFDLLNFLPI